MKRKIAISVTLALALAMLVVSTALAFTVTYSKTFTVKSVYSCWEISNSFGFEWDDNFDYVRSKSNKPNYVSMVGSKCAGQNFTKGSVTVYRETTWARSSKEWIAIYIYKNGAFYGIYKATCTASGYNHTNNCAAALNQ